MGRPALAAPPEHGEISDSQHTDLCAGGGWGGDVDIRLHILPAPRQPRLPRLYIGAIPGKAGYSIFDGTQFEGSPFPKSL